MGSDADLLVYDPNGKRTLSAKTHHQAVDRNIYEGFEVKGRIAATVAAGACSTRTASCASSAAPADTSSAVRLPPERHVTSNPSWREQ